LADQAVAELLSLIWRHSRTVPMNDSAKEIDTLDCKSDPQHFERLFTYLIRRQAQRHGMSVETLYGLVSESELRRAVRKAVDRFRPEARSITCYASWWLWQAVRRYVPPRSFTLVQPHTTGGGR
jgi:hypothetical protein